MRFVLLIVSISLIACLPHPVAPGFSPEVLRAEGTALQSPESPDSWANLGRTYLDAGDSDRAYSAFQEALRLNAENQAAVEGMATLMSSSWVSNIERTALAAPGDDEVWGDVGDHFLEMGQVDRALLFYVRAMSLDSSDSEWQNKVIDTGGADHVLAIFERQAVGQQDNDEWLGDYGDVFRRMARIDDACTQYRNAFALDPEDNEWREKVALCDGGQMQPFLEGEENVLSEHGMGHDGPVENMDPMAQIASLESLVVQNPENDEYLGRLGLLLAVQGDLERAKGLVEKAMHLDPTDGEWPRLFSALTGQTRVEILRGLVALHPALDELQGDLGDALVDLGRPEDAVQAYQEASRLDPEDKEWKQKLKILGH
jgi:cytochrome c-type biogenesis protein CcmH/NrfG